VASLLGIILYGTEAAWLMAALNGFYAAMGVYGWWSWGRIVEEQSITTLSWKQHLVVVVVGALCTVALVALMHAVGFSNDHVRMEAFIAAFALVATWLMSKKVLENWIYWTVGDLVAVYYNHQLGLHGYTLLMIVYIVLAVVGFINWRKQFTLQV
jgi:nicotinamide mononucleotide transporter